MAIDVANNDVIVVEKWEKGSGGIRRAGRLRRDVEVNYLQALLDKNGFLAFKQSSDLLIEILNKSTRFSYWNTPSSKARRYHGHFHCYYKT